MFTSMMYFQFLSMMSSQQDLQNLCIYPLALLVQHVPHDGIFYQAEALLSECYSTKRYQHTTLLLKQHFKDMHMSFRKIDDSRIQNNEHSPEVYIQYFVIDLPHYELIKHLNETILIT